MTSKRPQCWECQRRSSPCDGKIPVCGNCSAAGMVCPGYNNARPLTWLPTGKVSRLQKPKANKGRGYGAKPAAAAGRRQQQQARPGPGPGPRPGATGRLLSSSTLERGASGSGSSTRWRRRREEEEVRTDGRGVNNDSYITENGASNNNNSDMESITTTTNTVTNSTASSSGSDRSSDAGIFSDASPGDSTSLVAIVRSDQGHREDDNMNSSSIDVCSDGNENMSTTSLQVVASRQLQQWGSTNSSRQMQVSVPPDLRPEQWDFVDAIQYYNNLLLPKLRARQIVQNPAWGGELNGKALQALTAANRHCILAIAVGYRIMCVSIIHGLDLEPSTSGPASHLWLEFYRHMGKSIRALNDEIQRSGNVFNIFSSMAHLMSAEVLVSNSLSWRLHADGYLMLIRHCGGLRKLMNTSATPLLMQSFVIGITVFNTTSPSHAQLVDACNFDVDDVMALYEIGSSPLFYCPAPLFREIFLINRLRLEAALSSPDPLSDPSSSNSSSSSSSCDILARIDAYSVPPVPTESLDIDDQKAHNLLSVSLLFKSAVAVFASLTLPCTSRCCCCSSSSPRKPSCAELHEMHRAKLFQLLDTTSEFLPLLDHILWPVVVAGTAAATGGVGDRMLVEMYLLNGARDPFTGGCTGSALATMRRFWGSGKTAWDECFDQPHAWMI
ncbi:hypothetical protein BBK36DRAFT_1170543 [Trichoderma citrinoviride]|uniref:Zn(2)-C6 fungal-type domain-containing protein n=1 Tax=Trichoderma citrinoviride TaxID=58853 RepID=A0A2T4B6B2_9HYPO|nr:hypothetical protein BBK36DRAFT_1170543 [Trichoderma citrinoviride]PTB64873.1 hypothetical protein BBK36DRAFT_1170543 [Trichoderma citrinoviride]